MLLEPSPAREPRNARWVGLLPRRLRSRLDTRVQLQDAVGNTGWLFADRFLRMGVGLAVAVLVTRYLGPGPFGILTYGIVLVGLFASVAILGLESIVLRDLVREPAASGQILGTAFILRLASGSVALIVVIGMLPWIRPGEVALHGVIAVTAGTLILQAFEIVDIWFHSQVRSKYAVYARIPAFIAAALAKVMLVYARAPIVAFAWAGLGEIALGAVGAALAYRATGQRFSGWHFSQSRARQLLADSWPLLLSGIAIGLYMKIDVVMLGTMAGDKAVGTYAAATRISEVWYFIPTAIVTSLAPSLTAAKQASERVYYDRLDRLFNMLAAVAVAIAIPMTFLATPLVRLLYGDRYIAAGPMLSLHIWAALFIFLGIVQTCWTVNEGLTRLALSRTVVGAAANIVLNLALIPRYSGMGAAIATVISYALSGVVLNAFDPRTRHIFRSQVAAISMRSYIVRQR